MLARGACVSGSDAAPNAVTEELARLGARIFAGHDAANVDGADVVVVTSAVAVENPEVVAAHARGIPVLKRREFLREVTAGYRTLAVAGSHGKTTTTAMLGLIFTDAGLDPNVIVGGIVPAWKANARAGKGEWFIIEADEYDLAFLGLEPMIAVVTNVEYDHPDLFPTRADYCDGFARFMAQTRAEGVILACGEDATARELAEQSGRRVIRYGLGADHEWRAAEVSVNVRGGSDFVVYHENEWIGNVRLGVPGVHNVLNALGALAAAQGAGIDASRARATLERFAGVERRFQVRGVFRGAVVVDDYAHHPTEIRATLRAARARFPQKRIWALFQPHTFTRTRALLDDFARAFADADRVIVTEIYAAREQNDPGLSGAELARRIRGGEARFIGALEEVEGFLERMLGEEDVLVVLGAGSVTQVAERLVSKEDA